MTCAWLFCILALLGLPAALAKGGEGPVAWMSQTFLRLVLLSMIIVGPADMQSAAADKQIQERLRGRRGGAPRGDADPGPPGGAGRGARRPGPEAEAPSIPDQLRVIAARGERLSSRARSGPRRRPAGRARREAVIMEGTAPHGGLTGLTWGRTGFDGIMGRAMAGRAPGS